jgi:hypothetical protein
MNSSHVVRRAAIVAGPLLALVVGGATSSVRDQVGATNVGVALAIIVVLAALSSRVAGLTTAAVAALSFNYFHAQPYHSLRIRESRDVVIVALLVLLGLVVSDITEWRRRRDAIAFRHWTASEAPRRVTEMLETLHPVGEVWPAIATTIMDQLTLAECRFDPSVYTELPLISRIGGGRDETDDGFVLPSHGAAMPIVAGGQPLGYLVLRPNPGITSLWVERRVVAALADHLTIALTYTGHETGRSSTPKRKAENG